jgi:hypothetical protein
MNLRFFTTSGLLPLSESADRFIGTVHYFCQFASAMEEYRSMSDTSVKSLGVRVGQVHCGLVRCFPLSSGTTHGTDVLLTDHLKVFAGRERAQLRTLAEECVSELGIHYCMIDQCICPAPASPNLPSDLENVYLWADCPGEIDTAVRRIFVDGEGWLPRDMFRGKYLVNDGQSRPPLVTQIFADGLTADGKYQDLRLTPWEYHLLRSQTQRRKREKRKETH